MANRKLLLSFLMFAVGFMLPLIPKAYADLSYPDTTVSINYNGAYDYYYADGAGNVVDLTFREFPTVLLDPGETVTLSVTEKIVSTGDWAPVFRTGWDQSKLILYDIQPKSANDADPKALFATEFYNSDGHMVKTWYFAVSQDPTTTLTQGEQADYYIYFQYNTTGDYAWVQEAEMHSERWTFNSGYYQGDSGFIYDEVASKSGMLLEHGL
ncbi:hypothetical protein MFMK1_002931 [Metallumcola ferriviriculae]|uniref:Uncharacterized protein n=1 Tax=Metallumcola ferriviriculae TaxID=3039180 RepID=A0AAU0US51_9FIRM|nr:hypothetical protein MFMK1_002931 [Desulfitibacteraceae bacterium MK1]